MLSRRTVRVLVRTGLCLFFGFYLVLFVDNQYRVLPNSIHNHLPVHHTGHVLTDLAVSTCTKANPLSSCVDNSDGWHTINKDIYLGKSWLSAGYVRYQAKNEEDLEMDDYVVTEAIISRFQPKESPHSPHAKWEQREGGLWVKRVQRRHENDFHHIVSAVDVLYGADAVDPRPGWRVLAPALFIGASIEPRLTIKTGNEHRIPVVDRHGLRLRRDGRFKIVQLPDLHLSTGTGKCRDLFPAESGRCEADLRTVEFVGEMLDLEKPDLVILSGDQVNGDTAPDTQTAIFKFADILASRKIPYAAIFGNHDDSRPTSLSREEAMSVISQLPYSLAEDGPAGVSGVGNYYLEVLAPSSSHSALTIYLLDSHDSSPTEKGYDYIKDDQIKWFRRTAQALREQHRSYSRIHLDMAFIHIPLPEYRGPGHRSTTPDERLDLVGEHREPVMAPHHNSGFRDALAEEGVGVVSCGHDHVNSFCGLSQKPAPAGGSSDRNRVWLCYGGAAGYGGYGGYGGYRRRLRVFEVDSSDGSIKTWIRVVGEDQRKDEHKLVQDGRPVDPTG